MPYLSSDTPVLLVLLPDGVAVAPTHPPVMSVPLQALQRQLGDAIRVMVVNEASHPAIVHSFHILDLPSFVLVRKGVELWQQRGLPEGESIVQQLLSKLNDASPKKARL